MRSFGAREPSVFSPRHRHLPREHALVLDVAWECAITRLRRGERGSPTGGRQNFRADRGTFLRLDDFVCETTEREAAPLRARVEAVVAVVLLYCLAEIDVGRIARRVSCRDRGFLSETLGRPGR
jgi:hypothetical protein